MGKITEMTKEKVKEIANIIFHPEKISCIEFNKTNDEISFNVYTEWDLNR